MAADEGGHQLLPGHPQPLPSGAPGTLCGFHSLWPLPLLAQDGSGTKVPLQLCVWIQVSRKLKNEQKDGIEFFYNNSGTCSVSHKAPRGKPRVGCSLSNRGGPGRGRAEACRGRHRLREGAADFRGWQDSTPLQHCPERAFPLTQSWGKGPKMEKLPFPPPPCSYVLMLENKLLSLLSKNSALPSSEACFLATESVVTAGRSGAVPVLHIQDVLLGAQGWRARALRPAAVLDPLQDAVDVLQPALLGANPTGHSAHPAR